MTRIRAVFFDLDGTLYDRDAAIRRAAEEQFEAVPTITTIAASRQTR